MQKNVFDRRKHLVKLMTRGIALKDAVPKVMEKFGCSEKVVRNDWDRRSKWLPLIIQLEDKTLLHEVVAGLKEIIPMAWLIYSQAKGNPNARIGALKLAQSTYVELIKLLQSVGAVEKAPMKIETTHRHVDWEKLTDEERRSIIASARILIRSEKKES